MRKYGTTTFDEEAVRTLTFARFKALYSKNKELSAYLEAKGLTLLNIYNEMRRKG